MLKPSFIYMVSLPIYLVFLIIYLKRKKKFTSIFFITLLYFYIIAVISVTLFPLPTSRLPLEYRQENIYERDNFTPFNFLDHANAQFSYNLHLPFYNSRNIPLPQVGGNILLGIPLGFLLPLVWKRKTFLKTLAVGFCFSFTIEASQFLISLFLGYSYRITDIDDILLNTLGCALGYLIYKTGYLIARPFRTM